jgi:hypothetical protein
MLTSLTSRCRQVGHSAPSARARASHRPGCTCPSSVPSVVATTSPFGNATAWPTPESKTALPYPERAGRKQSLATTAVRRPPPARSRPPPRRRHPTNCAPAVPGLTPSRADRSPTDSPPARSATPARTSSSMSVMTAPRSRQRIRAASPTPCASGFSPCRPNTRASRQRDPDQRRLHQFLGLDRIAAQQRRVAHQRRPLAVNVVTQPRIHDLKTPPPAERLPAIQGPRITTEFRPRARPRRTSCAAPSCRTSRRSSSVPRE